MGRVLDRLPALGALARLPEALALLDGLAGGFERGAKRRLALAQPLALLAQVCEPAVGLPGIDGGAREPLAQLLDLRFEFRERLAALFEGRFGLLDFCLLYT
ncbi:hypothetical protein, partial [Halalkalicoccus jeotgali]|uniref:hypothetical protein n=1 Tax=Halalkalicoccus jeotgali TaxID=413810 RepID=UPI001F4CC9F4